MATCRMQYLDYYGDVSIFPYSIVRADRLAEISGLNL